jgi:hypothetical protein
MDKTEFNQYVKHIINQLGNDGVWFFSTIAHMEAFFLKADEECAGALLMVQEFAAIGEDISDVLGAEEARRLFRAV